MPTARVTSHVLRAEALGAWSTNCAVLGDLARGEAVIVDPGQGAAAAVPALLERLGLQPVAILLTHGHLDHLWAAPSLARDHGIPVHLHPDDAWLWEAPPAAFGPSGADLAAGFGFGDWDTRGVEVVALEHGQSVELAGLRIRVHHTPGHTPGHCTFVTDDLVDASIELDGLPLAAPAQVLLSGDLLFAGSIGRTDLAGGDPRIMARSLAETLARHDDGTLVIPGHGPATTLGEERATNPFLKDL
jgi:hydroxyacylglutathione hydrolase